MEAIWLRVLRLVFGGGADISGANPLPVTIAPIGGAKVVTEILNVTPILPLATTALGDCIAIDLTAMPMALAITVETTYDGAATQGIRVHARTSRNNVDWDTEDWDTWTPTGFAVGATIRQTEEYGSGPAYLRILIENLDPLQQVTNTRVFSTVG